jgi:hypothetical protein
VSVESIFFNLSPNGTTVAYFYKWTHPHTTTTETHLARVYLCVKRHIRRLNMIFMLQCTTKGLWHGSCVLIIYICFRDHFVDLRSNSKLYGAPKKFKKVSLSNQIIVSLPANLHSREHLLFSLSPNGIVVASVHERIHAHTPPQHITTTGTHSHECICVWR